jgi:hypothetical protein
VFKRVPTVKAKARHAAYRELDRQNVARLAAWKVGRRPAHRTNRAVGKGSGVKACGFFRVMIVPQADRVLLHGFGFLLRPFGKLLVQLFSYILPRLARNSSANVTLKRFGTSCPQVSAKTSAKGSVLAEFAHTLSLRALFCSLDA